MIYRAIIYLSTFSPLLGVWFMEQGEFGLSINQTGHANGATLAFALYLIISFFVALIVTNGAFFSSRGRAIPASPQPYPEREFFGLGLRALVVMLCFTAFTVFAMGGLNVLLGGVGKGEFRATLGGFGAIGYLILKYYAPAVFAFTCIRYSRSRKTARDTGLIVSIALLLIVLAMSWGFKAGALLAILPALIVAFWNARARKVALLVPVCLAFLVFTFWLFDAEDEFNIYAALQFLFIRLTVLQGDVAWKMWDLYMTGFEFPDYSITLLVAIGDRLFSALTGITIDQPEEWVLSHFGLMLTYLSGYPIHGILGGHNVTGTPFSEGIVAGGLIGVIVFGAISGFVVGFTFLILRSALCKRNDKIAATTACYAVMGVMAWMVGGSIVSLFHISVIFGVVTTLILLYLLELPLLPRTSHRTNHGNRRM